MSARAVVLAGLLGSLVAFAPTVRAETYRLVGPDGTVHYTNASADPTYERLGIAPVRAVPGAAVPASVPGSGLVQLIRSAAERHGVPEKLVRAVIRAESGFNPLAVSPKGARGLMQLMPQTASMLGVKNSFDPAENIDGGVRHLRGLIDRFGSDLRLALAAYNAGEQAVATHGGVPPYAETHGYVQKVLTLFNGGRGEASVAPDASPPAQLTYRTVDGDGTVTYTNIAPRAASITRRR